MFQKSILYVVKTLWEVD